MEYLPATRNSFKLSACRWASLISLFVFVGTVSSEDSLRLRRLDEQPSDWPEEKKAQPVQPTQPPKSTDKAKSPSAQQMPKSSSFATEEKITVDADEVEFDRPNNLIRARGHVVIRRGDVKLSCDSAEYNTETKVAAAEGGVHLTRPGEEWSGPKLTFSFADTAKETSGVVENFRGIHSPWYVAGKQAEKLGNRYVVDDGFITTCDKNPPHYRLKAARIVIYPDDHIEARGVTLCVGDVPIFWFPYIKQSLKDKRPVFEIIPGRSSRMGAYVLSGYNWWANDSFSGTVHLDERTRRGVGGGLDSDYKLGNDGTGSLKTYYLDDAHPIDPDNVGEEVGHHRYRISFQHRQDLGGDWAATARLNDLSDADILKDFFEREFQREIQPDSFVDITHTAPTHTLSLFARPQINGFFETSARLPEARFDAVRQPLLRTPIYYEGETSVGYFERGFARQAGTLTANNGSLDFYSTRVDTFHQFLYPQLYGGWLSVVPRVGGRMTFYENSSMTGNPSVVRGVFDTGAEIGTKLSQKFDITDNALDIHGLRHIFEPSMIYSYVRTNRQPDELLQFDTLRPTTRLLPIEFPQFRDIDSIDATNILRPMFRNRLQTRRATGAIVDLLDWSLYADYRINKSEGTECWSDVFSELVMRPFDWLNAGLFLREDPHRGVLRELNTDVALIRGTDWSATVGTRYLKDDSNEITTGLHAKLSDKWGVRVAERFEAREGRWEEQEYTVERDLHCWTAALSFRYRDARVGPDDYRVFLVLTLKAFPGFRIGVGQ